jgi:hypothetical protein
MATLFTVEGTQAQGTKVKDRFCEVYKYDDNKLVDETEKEFASRMILEFIIGIAKGGAVDAAEPDYEAIRVAEEAALSGVTIS